MTREDEIYELLDNLEEQVSDLNSLMCILEQELDELFLKDLDKLE